MIKMITLLFLTICSKFVFGQSKQEEYKNLLKNNDTAKIKILFTEWEKTNPNDPTLYTSAINYYFSQSKEEIISLDGEQKSNESIPFRDSTGKVSGYINSNLGYNPDKLIKAVEYANRGIKKFPDRLDIRFGKSYILVRIEDYENFTKEIITTVEYSIINKNNWLWIDNKKLEDSENFMLGSIQEYLKQLYDTEDDNLLRYMIQIGETTLKYYPNHIEILSSTAVALMLSKQYDKAISYLKHAEKLNPKDFIVLNNIAQGYKMKGDKANAIKYYELVIKYGPDQAKQQAKDNINVLKISDE
jgi:tetratricopeptide (TPR) repeat protein